MTNNVVHYRYNRHGALQFEYNGRVQTFFFSTKRDAYRRFKQDVGIKSAKLVEDRAPITYGCIE